MLKGVLVVMVLEQGVAWREQRMQGVVISTVAIVVVVGIIVVAIIMVTVVITISMVTV